MRSNQRRKPRAKAERVPLDIPLRDKIKIIAFPGGLFALILWAYAFTCMQQQTFAFERVIKKWQTKYELSASQVKRLLEIELSFHGSGNPFADVHVPTKQDIYAHHVDMSLVVAENHRERFLDNLKKSKSLQYAPDE